MADYSEEAEQLDGQLADLETSLNTATQMTAAFQAEVGGMQSSLFGAGQEAQRFSKSLSSSLRGAFGDLVFEGDKLSDVLKNVAQSMVQTTFNRAVTPVTDGLASALTTGLGNVLGGLLPFENGAAFSAGRVSAFAKGGVVSGPTTFPMRGGMGLMGEAGPEAIMPLSRGADGSLGVRSQGGAGAVAITMNISTPNAESFQRSRSQIAANMTRAIQAGQRNL